VGLTTKLPLDYGNSSSFVVEGHPTPAAGHEPDASIRTVGGDYFGALGIQVLSGRTITDDDVEGKPLVVVINRALAERVFAGEEPVGKRLTFGSGNGASTWTVAGVVADVPIDRLGEQPRNTLYFPYMQDTDVDFFRVAMRTTADPISAAAELRRVVHDLDPEVPLVQPATMEQLVADSPSVFMRRYPLMLVGAFAISALALALVGLFGVVSYSVAQRTQELGVRVALGAQQRDIMGLILRRGTGLAAIGVALGLLGAAWLTRFLGSLLYGVMPLDAITYGAVALLLGISAILATLGPARRATRVDPMMALRSE
jgi:putative ABC transport system permease protein